MTKALSDIITDPHDFLESLFSKIESVGLKVDDFFLDHICYRVATEDEYQTKKIELLDHGDLLIESMVNGRMISTYKLHSPILFNKRIIDVLELPAPKPGAKYMSGLEHVEFVTTEPLRNLVIRYPALKFETYGIDKPINADITLKFEGQCVRFHNQTLEDVIAEEKLL
ncbi:MAG: VOC family protein [Bacteriovorax sp.]|nr:VOC family protein [Bacteriovorax sp.]